MQFYSWFLRGVFYEFDGWELGRCYVRNNDQDRADYFVYQAEDGRIFILREQYAPYRRDDVYEYPNLDAAKASEWGWVLNRLMRVDVNALGGFE
jgi:hypothetical protein